MPDHSAGSCCTEDWTPVQNALLMTPVHSKHSWRTPTPQHQKVTSQRWGKKVQQCFCDRYLQKKEHNYNLKCWADLTECLDLVPLIGDKICPPDADWGRVWFWLTSTCKSSKKKKKVKGIQILGKFLNPGGHCPLSRYMIRFWPVRSFSRD